MASDPTDSHHAPLRRGAIALDYLGYAPHRDDFTLHDDLDRRVLVRTIAEAAAVDRPPLVFGVHGDWGSGKTSALRAIRYLLTSEDHHGEVPPDITGGLFESHVVTVWFDAWRYQNEAAPVVALIQEIRRQLSLTQKLAATGKKLADVTIRTVLGSLDQVAKFIGRESAPVSISKIQDLGEKYEHDHFETVLQSDSIQNFLTQALSHLLPDKQEGFHTPRIVIFIDDLDRCTAEAAYRLLEGLKIYLSLPNCVFILGMNQKIVTEAIAERLKKDDSDKTVLLRAEAYLEKLCGNIWRLPLPPDPIGYFIKLIDSEPAQKAFSAMAESVTTKEGHTISFLPPNPRRLRALANVFNRLRHRVAAEELAADLDPRLLVVAYIYQFHSDLFQRWQYDADFIDQIRGWLKTGTVDPDTEGFFKILSLPTKIVADLSSPTPGSANLGSRFPDPSAPGIFWIAPILQRLPLSEIAAKEFRDLLRLDMNAGASTTAAAPAN